MPLMPVMLQGTTHHPAGLEPSPTGMACAARDLVRSGQILSIPRCITDDDWLGRLQGIVRDGLRLAGGDPALSRTIRLEEMHRHYSGEQIVRAADASIRQIKPLSGRLLKHVLRSRLGMEQRFWFDRRPKVRFHPPSATLEEDRQVFQDYARRRGHGKVDAHDPHLDSWHHCPVNSVNLWIALGRVTPRNGMTAFPDTHGRALVQRDHAHDVAGDQWFGTGVDTDLRPGDAWLFPGDLLHTSILNASDETRVAISFRLTFSKPYFSGSGTESFVDSRYADSPLEFWTLQHPADPIRGVVRHWRGPRRGPEVNRGPQVVHDHLEPLEVHIHEDGSATFAAEAMAPGTVRVLDRQRLVCRDLQGTYTVVGRHCPHRGADLAAAELNAEGLVCPWHRLVFNPENGSSVGHCDHALAANPCQVRHGEVVVPPSSR
ncbi:MULTISPECIES: Rieske 2Fe-2S domain-containing protein [Aphanothece]|uniref:Rieske 2Fe-2S domain-containing protein n=1 Tax=Aphanothece TaxID=1121 RepID=UPI00398F73C1